MQNKVKDRRSELGLSQDELAERANVPRSTISEIETGKRTPGVDIALLLARALVCTVEDLFSLWLTGAYAPDT